jgi:hypothetical protein
VPPSRTVALAAKPGSAETTLDINAAARRTRDCICLISIAFRIG